MCNRLLTAVLSVLLSAVAYAETPMPSDSAANDLIKTILLQKLPREYENTKQWGKTKARWDGLHVSFDGLQIKTKRRRKEVNHGTWTRYKATLRDPERTLWIQTSNLRSLPNQRAAFDLIVDAKLDLTSRLAEWVKGVQLYSFSGEADATVRLTVACEVGLTFDATRFPPDLVLDPHVTAAQLDLREFNLHAISDADGPVVHKLGDGLRDVLQEEVNERQPKLVEKMNRALAKHTDKMRLSIQDAVVSGWSRVLPPTP